MSDSEPKGNEGLNSIKQEERVKLIASDGSVLNALPSEIMMDPAGMSSLDQGLANLAGLEPHAAHQDQGVQAARSQSQSQQKSLSESQSSSTGGSAIPGATTTSIPAGSGQVTDLHQEGERSERVFTDESRDDETDGDAVEEVKGSAVKKRKKEARATGGAAAAGGEGAAEAQKQKASRDRNREHARNTRIRKKQYVENLKLQVGEMLQAKAKEERDILRDASHASAERAARRQMVLNVFYLRATEELSPHAWGSILDEAFTCVMPITPFRSFPPSEAREDHRLIKGVDGMIQDTASLAVFIQTISVRSSNPTGRKVKYQFYTSPEDTVVGPNALMCKWLMKTENATECGAQCEVFSHGILRAVFSAENRIKRLELVFDVMSLMQQLQRAMGGGGFRMIPNTLETAMQPSRHARLVCSAERPYWNMHVNEAWTALMGHSLEEAKLFPFSLMNGPAEANNGGELDAFVHTCIGSNLKTPGMANIHVITREMRRLPVAMQAYPLGTKDGQTTHLLLSMEEVPVCTALPQTVAGLNLHPFV